MIGNPKLSAFEWKKERYRKFNDVHLAFNKYYRNEIDGVEFEVYERKGQPTQVIEISYKIPKAKEKSIQCNTKKK